MSPISDLTLPEQTEEVTYRDLCTRVQDVIRGALKALEIHEPLAIPGQELGLTSDGALLLPDGHVVELYQLGSNELTELMVALSHLTRPA